LRRRGRFLAPWRGASDARFMIEVRALPQLEVADWSHIVRIRLRARRGSSAAMLVAILSVLTAALAALLALA
jgi:hypothetical protein